MNGITKDEFSHGQEIEKVGGSSDRNRTPIAPEPDRQVQRHFAESTRPGISRRMPMALTGPMRRSPMRSAKKTEPEKAETTPT